MYQNISCETVLSSADVTAEVEVRLSSKTDHVALVPREDVLAYVPTGVDDKSVLIKVVENSMPESVEAPINKGEKLAEAAVYYADQEIARADLVAAETVERNLILYIGSLIKDFVSRPVVMVVLALLILLAAAYVALTVYVNYAKRKKIRQHNNRSKVVRMKDFKDR